MQYLILALVVVVGVVLLKKVSKLIGVVILIAGLLYILTATGVMHL